MERSAIRGDLMSESRIPLRSMRATCDLLFSTPPLEFVMQREERIPIGVCRVLENLIALGTGVDEMLLRRDARDNEGQPHEGVAFRADGPIEERCLQGIKHV